MSRNTSEAEGLRTGVLSETVQYRSPSGGWYRVRRDAGAC